MSAEITLANDELLIIETPERVPLHFSLASIGNRFLACIFDHFLQFLIMLAIGLGLYELGGYLQFQGFFADAPKWIYAVTILVLFALWSSYFVVFEWLWNGQTPGKRWLKLRVIREDGRPVTFWEAAVRNLIRIFDMMPFPFYSVGLISVFANSRDQRIGDMLAGTVVVRERESEAPTFDRVFSSPVSDIAMRRTYKVLDFSADISLVNEAEIEVVQTFLRRRFDMPDNARQWMAWRVATPILYKIRPTYDLAAFSYEAFLEELVHRYVAVRRSKS